MYRIGTTSYILPADILANVEYLAPLVDDIELVLFETPDHGGNLPDAALRKRLGALAAAHDLTFTVHLPLDLCVDFEASLQEAQGRGSGGDAGLDADISLERARRAIEATRELAPFAYVAHLDGRGLIGRGEGNREQQLGRWQEGAYKALKLVSGWLDDPALLCVENLEAWDPAAFAPVIDALPVSRTIDIGHFWLNGEDPMHHLVRWIGRTRVVHMHGVAERDHVSLSHVSPERLDPVLGYLAEQFSGVLTLEVFSEPDLQTSLAALKSSPARTGPRKD
jgi:sugar phosphate isomerase/epimerase